MKHLKLGIPSKTHYVSKQKRGLFNEIGFLWSDSVGWTIINEIRGDLYSVL